MGPTVGYRYCKMDGSYSIKVINLFLIIMFTLGNIGNSVTKYLQYYLQTVFLKIVYLCSDQGRIQILNKEFKGGGHVKP